MVGADEQPFGAQTWIPTTLWRVTDHFLVIVPTRITRIRFSKQRVAELSHTQSLVGAAGKLPEKERPDGFGSFVLLLRCLRHR